MIVRRLLAFFCSLRSVLHHFVPHYSTFFVILLNQDMEVLEFHETHETMAPLSCRAQKLISVITVQNQKHPFATTGPVELV